VSHIFSGDWRILFFALPRLGMPFPPALVGNRIQSGCENMHQTGAGNVHQSDAGRVRQWCWERASVWCWERVREIWERAPSRKHASGWRRDYASGQRQERAPDRRRDRAPGRGRVHAAEAAAESKRCAKSRPPLRVWVVEGESPQRAAEGEGRGFRLPVSRLLPGQNLRRRRRRRAAERSRRARR